MKVISYMYHMPTKRISHGVHVDNLTSDGIAEIQKAMDGLVKETVLRWKNGK